MIPSTDLDATDFFCGMGGSSTGLRSAGITVKVAANHWGRAIETHSANHPDTEHLCADISQIDLRYLPKTRILWASPICTEVSPAGGKSKKGQDLDLFQEHGHVAQEAFTRTRVTFWEVIRACELHRYEIVFIENVVEAAQWELFDTWLAGMATLGYEHQFVSVSAAHITGTDADDAPQWRDRMYIAFNLRGVRAPDVNPRPLAWCWQCGHDVAAQQWWKRPGRRIGKYGAQYIYVCPEGGHGQIEPYVAPAAQAIDWTDLGSRIGDRTRPLAAATMRRIQRGLDMWQRGDFDRHIVMGTNHGGSDGRHLDPHRSPLPTRSTKNGTALVSAFISKQHSGFAQDNPSLHKSPLEPLPTMRAQGTHGLVVAAAGNTYDAATRNEDGYIRAWPADGSPVPAQTTTGQLGIITTLRRNSTPTDAHRDPLAAVTAGGRHHGLVIPYRKGARPHPPTGPVSAQATRSQHGVMRPAVDINDCHFRMLTPREAANAQAFPRDYIIHGNSGEQQMQAGNAVAVNVAAWLGAAATRSLDERTAS